MVGKKYAGLSLQYKGKPFEIMGVNADWLREKGFGFSGDPNGEFQDFFGLIEDNFSLIDRNLDNNRNIGQVMNGSAFFSSISKSGEVFTFSAAWLFMVDVNDETKNMLIDHITTKLFPVLRNHLKIEQGWHYTLKSKDFIEEFKIANPENNESGEWRLSYQVKLR